MPRMLAVLPGLQCHLPAHRLQGPAREGIAHPRAIMPAPLSKGMAHADRYPETEQFGFTLRKSHWTLPGQRIVPLLEEPSPISTLSPKGFLPMAEDCLPSVLLKAIALHITNYLRGSPPLMEDTISMSGFHI